MTDELLFKAVYLPEAGMQLVGLSQEYREKIVEAIKTFEKVGTAYKNINDLGGGLFEIKPKGVRACHAWGIFYLTFLFNLFFIFNFIYILGVTVKVTVVW